RNQRALAGKPGHLSGPGHAGDIWRVSSLDASREHRIDVSRALKLDGDAGPLLEWPDHGEEALQLAAAPHAEDGDAVAAGWARVRRQAGGPVGAGHRVRQAAGDERGER